MSSNQTVDNILCWDGTLSPAEFYVAAFAFATQWNKFNSGLPKWSWLNCSKHPCIAANEKEGYLSLENVILPLTTEEDWAKGIHVEGEQSCLDEDEFTDIATLIQMHGHEGHHYDFHIVYSTSYRVPVLYFRAYCSDGQTLSLDEIGRDLPANFVKELNESKWMFITQEEHPFLNRPWHELHPCGTAEWMKLLSATEASREQSGFPVEKYLVSWFSVVGQVIGLKIPLQMLGNTDLLISGAQE